jgi:hypothetical protein
VKCGKRNFPARKYWAVNFGIESKHLLTQQQNNTENKTENKKIKQKTDKNHEFINETESVSFISFHFKGSKPLK